jgi:uncharacterized SAM-binding protein YcdF (DUF218 family)
MPATDNSSRRVSGRRRRFGIGFLLALLVAIGVGVFRNAGHRLVREDSLRKTDVIVVLSGGSPFRAEAVGAFSQEELAALGIHFVGEEEYNREILVQEGVPDSAIEIFPDFIANTQDEVEEIARKIRRDGKRTLIIVTSPQHTRRVKAVWQN